VVGLGWTAWTSFDEFGDQPKRRLFLELFLDRHPVVVVVMATPKKHR
jgi:hypothetical protein